MKLLVTGATGFVGRALLPRLLQDGHEPRAALRRPADLPADVQPVMVGDIGGDTDWTRAVAGVDAVIHLAARVHQMGEAETDPRTLFLHRQINRDGTRRLARAAREAGARRMVFLSTIKAVADATTGTPVTDATPPRPGTSYGLSKLEGEMWLADEASTGALEMVALRPPLVVGWGAAGNFARLAGAIRRGWPLPLGAIKNRRSLIAVTNLADAIATAVTHPGAAGRAFGITDGPPLSTPDLARVIAAALGRPARLVSVPPAWLRAGLGLLGKGDWLERLSGDLEIDASGFAAATGWQPPESLDEALARTAPGG